MIKCQHCGQFIKPNPGNACPHCGKKGRVIYEHLSDGLNLPDEMITTLEQKTELINYKKIFIGLLLTVAISTVGYSLTGLQGFIIGFLLSTIVFLCGPAFKTTILKIFTDRTK